MKFGGSCLKNAACFDRIVEIVKAENEPIVLIVSAIYGVTDLLVKGLEFALDSEKNVKTTVRKIANIHEKLVLECIDTDEIAQKTRITLETKIIKLKRLLYGISYTEEINPPIKANILSYGERLSALLVAGILKSRGARSIALESDNIGILTDCSFENATAILPTVKTKLQETLVPHLGEGYIPVITGFFGHTEEGKITTFGRNGSDYSAAVVAYGLGARVLDIWKDVDGFMTADPKIVKNVQRIDKLSYYEAAELSYFGARILHPRTVEPLLHSGIKLCIRNMHNPESHTLVQVNGYEKSTIIKSVTCNEDIAALKIRGPGVGYKSGIIASIGKKLSELDVNIYSVITSQTCINLLIDYKDVQRSYEALKSLSGGIIEKIDVENDIALVAVVGDGLLKTRGLGGKIFSAFAEKKINVEMISSGASDVATYFIVKKEDSKTALNAIHSNIFDNN
ncbi:MAG: aspartate kinase [Candidatus Odinarchaeota archaeon]